MSTFKEYQSKPVTRKAYEVKESDVITDIGESTSSVLVGGDYIEFKHYEPVSAGDYVVYLNDSDIYHCSREVFHERNVVAL